MKTCNWHDVTDAFGFAEWLLHQYMQYDCFCFYVTSLVHFVPKLIFGLIIGTCYPP